MSGNNAQMFKIARSAQAVSHAQNIFNGLYPGVSAHVRVISFSGGVLKIATSASAVIADIRLQEKGIKEKINKVLNPLIVERIVCLASGGEMR